MSKRWFEITVPVRLNLREENIEDIICAALEGGIGYWACLDTFRDEWKERKKGGGDSSSNNAISGYAAKLLLDAKSLFFVDAEDETDDAWELTLEKLLKGVELWINEKGCDAVSFYFPDWGELDMANTDADDADAIVQYALFGELVFS